MALERRLLLGEERQRRTDAEARAPPSNQHYCLTITFYGSYVGFFVQHAIHLFHSTEALSSSPTPSLQEHTLQCAAHDSLSLSLARDSASAPSLPILRATTKPVLRAVFPRAPSAS
jgi:hypothetical protein